LGIVGGLAVFCLALQAVLALAIPMVILAILLVLLQLHFAGGLIFDSQQPQSVWCYPGGSEMDRAIRLMKKYPLIDGHNVKSPS
jgi:hypothetical protein